MAHVCFGIKTSRILLHFLFVFFRFQAKQKNPLNWNGIVLHWVRVLGRHKISTFSVKNNILHLIRVCGPHRDFFLTSNIATGEKKKKKRDDFLWLWKMRKHRILVHAMPLHVTSNFFVAFFFLRSFLIVTEKMPLKIFLYCLQSGFDHCFKVQIVHVARVFPTFPCCPFCEYFVFSSSLRLVFIHKDDNPFHRSVQRPPYRLWFQPKESILEEVWTYLSLGCPFQYGALLVVQYNYYCYGCKLFVCCSNRFCIFFSKHYCTLNMITVWNNQHITYGNASEVARANFIVLLWLQRLPFCFVLYC